jgi:hypothetical protein
VPDDDEVGCELLCGVDDFLGGVAQAYLGMDGNAVLRGFGRDSLLSRRTCCWSTWISSLTSPTVAP